MKKLFLLAWPIALAAVSCSNEEVVSVNNDANEIKFTAVANNATRANTSQTFCNYALPDQFDVWACTNGKSYFEKVNYAKKSTGKWETSADNLRFWPNSGSEALDFFALRNYQGTPIWNAAGFNAGTEEAPINTKLTTDFTVATAVGEQVDLIYAVETDKTKPATEADPNKGDVNLNFRHALSQIVFTAQNTNKNLAVEITKVEVINVANGGTCALPTTTTKQNYEDHPGTGVTDPSPVCTWTGLAATTTDYEVETIVKKMVGVTAENVNLTNGTDKKEGEVLTRNLDKALLLIPQTTTKATINTTDSKPSTVKASGTKSMIAVTCRIWNLNKDNAETKDAEGNVLDVVIFNGTTYIPFAANWAPGKKYIYNLVFGSKNGGYDENGKDVLVPVSFTVSVDDFTTVVPGNVYVDNVVRP